MRWCLSSLSLHRRSRLSRDAGSEAGPQALAVADRHGAGRPQALRRRVLAEGWPEGVGPTAGTAKRNPSGRKPGRPKRPFPEALKLIVLRSRVKTYEAQGYSRESATLAAMTDFHWPQRAKAGEVKRVLLEMRRADKAERPKPRN